MMKLKGALKKRNPFHLNKANASQALTQVFQGLNVGKRNPKQGADLMGQGFQQLFLQRPQRTCMPLGTVDVLLRRPVLPLRIPNNDIDIDAGSNIFAAIVADTGWGASGLEGDSNRIIISRNEDPNDNYSLIQKRFVRWIRPYLSVYASTPGVALDHELSKQIARLAASNLALVVDAGGKGKNLALAPSLFSHSTAQGITLEPEQVFEFGDNSRLKFDYKGEGEMADYTAADKKAGAAINVAVEIGCDIILTDTPNEDVEDLIEQAMEMAA